MLVRWGGDKFLLLAPGLKADAGLRFAERLAGAVRAGHPLPPWQHLPLSASLGVSATRRTPLLFAQPDAALYRVKRAGKGRTGLGPDVTAITVAGRPPAVPVPDLRYPYAPPPATGGISRVAPKRAVTIGYSPSLQRMVGVARGATWGSGGRGREWSPRWRC